MKYIAITEHRGYMETPKEFDTKEEAIKYCEDNRSFSQGYVIHGDIVYKPTYTKIDPDLMKKTLDHLSKMTEKRAENDFEGATWKMKNNSEVPMKLMSDDHIMNCIRLIQRSLVKKKVLEENPIDIKKYLKLRQYDALCYHAVKRGLAKMENIKYG